MKNLFGILCAACGVMLMPACTSDDIESDFQGALDEAGMTEVTLNLGGDYVEVYDSPLTRAEVKKKLYAINVYYSGLEEVDSKSKEHSWHMYAFGLFDDLTKMKIKLSDKFVYKFECTVTKDDRNEVMYYYTRNGKSPFYSYPFAKIDKYVTAQEKYTEKDQTNVDLVNKTMNKNAFTYSTKDNLTEIKSGKAYVKFIDNRIDKVTQVEAIKYATTMQDHGFGVDSIRYNTFNNPAIDRWYGELEDFSVESLSATIPMFRTAFGLKLVVTPPSEGKVLVSSDLFKLDVLAKDKNVSTPTVIESCYSFDKVYDCWNALVDSKVTGKDSTKCIQKEITLTFSLEHSLEPEPLNKFKPTISKKITVTRNKLTTVVFDAEKVFDSSISVTEDDVIEPDTTIIVK